MKECTDKEWQHCRVEKMSCEGCYYENKLKSRLAYYIFLYFISNEIEQILSKEEEQFWVKKANIFSEMIENNINIKQEGPITYELTPEYKEHLLKYIERFK